MLRYLSALALLGAVWLIPVHAQVYTIQPRPMTVSNKPRGGFSLSLQQGGATNVRFEGVGAVASRRNIGDTTSVDLRFYDDGTVGFDTRAGATGPGSNDGRTNTWSYNFAEQVMPDGNIAMHQYSTANNGSTFVSADSGSMSGVDLQYDYVIGVSGSPVTERAWTFSWGLMGGATFSPINAKTRGQIEADLVTITDLYSVEGAVVPEAPYTAPSRITVDGLTPNGLPTTYTIDNTVLLNNRPYFRSEPTITPGGATVDGFWQVKGAYYSFRIGPWARWQLSRYLSVRASIGGTYSFLGVRMEHDELVSGIDVLTALRGGDDTRPDKNERWGVYGALDAEWWVSDRTGFFAGITYESSGDDVILSSDDAAQANTRRAVIELPNGAGFRAGISVLF